MLWISLHTSILLSSNKSAWTYVNIVWSYPSNVYSSQRKYEPQCSNMVMWCSCFLHAHFFFWPKSCHQVFSEKKKDFLDQAKTVYFSMCCSIFVCYSHCFYKFVHYLIPFLSVHTLHSWMTLIISFYIWFMLIRYPLWCRASD